MLETSKAMVIDLAMVNRTITEVRLDFMLRPTICRNLRTCCSMIVNGHSNASCRLLVSSLCREVMTPGAIKGLMALK